VPIQNGGKSTKKSEYRWGKTLFFPSFVSTDAIFDGKSNLFAVNYPQNLRFIRRIAHNTGDRENAFGVFWKQELHFLQQSIGFNLHTAEGEPSFAQVFQ
jgi:hypothetical protein